ncbi:FAD-binding oxidoreductase [Rhodococcus olei]|uniref:FAD-binding oxidoreductase n=1 Tax=Rhodococcus olei TaxID=2161675 RepID=A0ABP8PGY5_9NOCA
MTFLDRLTRNRSRIASAPADPMAPLREQLTGRLAVPSDVDWDAASQAWNLAVTQRPRAVVHAATARDVIAAVEFAAAHDLTVSAQPGGHGATRALDDTILVRTGALDDIWIDADARVARVGAGVKWGQLQKALAGTGLTGLVGSNADVTVVGFCLSGGLSWFSRAFGAGAHSLRAVELVDARGKHRWVSEESDPELMWALAGGGGDFGIVTAAEIALHPVPDLHGGRVAFPAAQAREVLAAFASATAVAPAETTLWASLMHFPPLPMLPEEIRGQSFVFVDALHVGSSADLDGALASIRAAGTVLRDGVGPLRPEQVADVCEEPVDPSPATTRSWSLRTLDDEVLDRIVSLAGDGSGTPLTQVQIRHLGAALRTADPARTATGSVAAEYQVMTLAMVPDAGFAAPVAAATTALGRALADWDAGPTVLSFLGESQSVADAFDAETLERLRSVKESVDPAATVRGNYPVRGR